MGRLDSIDCSLPNVWHCWYKFCVGKKRNFELDSFTYLLEDHLLSLCKDLSSGTYKHGPYKTFVLTDTKRRLISVATTRDKIVHRLIYDYLTQVFDKTFIYDAWSCRVGKGVIGAIERTQKFLTKYPHAYVWRADITKFFDSVNHEILKKRIRLKLKDKKTLEIIDTIIDSYRSFAPATGMPIGNLSSQVFTNIYLHELDRYILHVAKPFAYLRYGDDFIVIMYDLELLKLCQEHLTVFIDQNLKLSLHPTNNLIIPVKQGVHFLGCDIYPGGRRLRKRVYNRIEERLDYRNSSSYRAHVIKHSKQKMIKWVDWNIMNMLAGNL